MQAITIAVGKTGIDFFAQQLIVKELIKTLSTLTPPDREITISSITVDYSSADNIDIKLTRGKLNNFTPVFQSISQQPGGAFSLQLADAGFSAQYNWYETYQWTSCSFIPYAGTVCQDPVNENNTFNYAPTFSNLAVTVPLQFQYDSANQEWEVVALTSTAKTTTAQANIPSDSVIQYEDQQCFSSHVSDTTAAAMASIDFNTPIGALIKGIVASIPGSGNLGSGIVYDFSLGDSGLLFPGNDGIQMGVKGGASYNGTAFSGPAQPTLPLPAPLADSDTHHLNMYVSNYEIDALHWAYYEAGKLNLLIKPENLPDPQLLKVSSYVSYEPTLKPYSAFVMNAEITQNSAPVTSFQTAYVYTAAVMSLLQNQLPANIYQLIQAIAGNAYLSQAEVNDFLTSAGVPNQYFAAIENAAQISAMALTQDISYTLTIQNNAAPQPDIKFSVKRIDVLNDLELGTSSNNTQTLQFGFTNAVNTVTYDSSSIPGFNGPIFEAIVWVIAESLYVQNLIDLGKTGVPLPIMADFQFDFTNAELSVQEGYVSILANVLYKS